MQLRHYQQTAIDKTLDWFADGKQKPLITLPTATGKSLVQAGLVQKILSDFPYVRILACTHSKELVQQNHDEIKSIWPECPAGIYSAGLKRREAHKQVLFAGIQSIYNKAEQIGHTDIIIVDEAHSISRHSDTMWGQFFKDSIAINPNAQIMGLTATPYRLDSGLLVPNTFDGVAYEYPILEAIKDGYLCEIVSAPVETHLKTDGVKKRGGEYIAGEMERAFDKDHLTRACVKEIIKYGADRQSWMIFAAGNTHARHITEMLIEYGIDARCVTQDTPRAERDQAVEDHKNGKLKCLVNNLIFTTGYNNPRLDLIACLRATQSAGLWVQICGRGMRLFANKLNCLLLDFAHNIDRHGPIDQIRGKHLAESSGEGEAPLKQCPKCFEPVYAAVMRCPNCGHEFPEKELNVTAQASTGAVLSTQIVPQEYQVFSVGYKRNAGKDGKPDSMMVVYNTMTGQMREWVFFDHPDGSTPYKKAVKWAQERGVIVGSANAPYIDLDSALEIDWPKPSSIIAIKEGKYWQVKKCIFNG